MLLSDLIYDISPDANSDCELAATIETVSPDPRSLWVPFLALSLKRIDCKAVAQALLIQAGKWNPARESPEAI